MSERTVREDMKIFISIQAVLIAAAVLLCVHARGLSDDVGITDMDSIQKIHNSDCDNITVIYDTDELNDEFYQFDYANADYGLDLYGTAIFVGTPKDSFSFSKHSTFCTIDVDKVIEGNIQSDSIDVEIKGGFYYETKSEQKYRLMDAEAMEIETPSERLFALDLGGMNYMIPGKKYLIIAQTLDFNGKMVYRLNGYQISWLCLDDTESKVMKKEYVYSDCSTNEIFSPEQDVIDEFYQKKQAILSDYGVG